MRRNDEGGYPRGEETRNRILAVAVNLFGIKGFDSVTTREIATEASVPPASLRYYFSDKRGLYIACLEHVEQVLFKLVEPALVAAEALVDDGNAKVDDLIESYCELQDARITSLIGGPDNGAVALFTIRHDLPSKGGASDLAGDATAVRRMSACYLRMIMRISGDRLDIQTAMIVAALVNGELVNIGLRRNRLAQMGWDITPERVEWMKRAIRQHTRAVLESYRA